MSARRRMPRAGRVLPACLLAALVALPGSGDAAGTATEQRAVAGVRRVVMRATGELIVREGPSERLVVEAEPQLLPKIASEVRDGTLYLEFHANQINTPYPLRFHLTVKRLEGLDSVASAEVHIGALHTDSFVLKLTGSGDVDIEALDAARFETQLTGAGNVSVGGGRVGQQTLILKGSGDYTAGALDSRKASVNIDGSGNATVRTSEQLVVRIGGTGDVRFHGNPRVDEIISGAGSVTRADGS